jgi:hypothetical protein
MSDYIFDPDKCPVPPLPHIPPGRLIEDCEIPPAPDPIRQCPDLSTDLFPLPDLPNVPPGGGTTNPGGDCRVVKVCNPCIPNVGEFIEECLPAARLIFRKDCSFRVWAEPSDVCENQFDMVVDIGGGPTYSVFWQDAGGVAPKWTTCPQIGHSVTVGGTTQPGWFFSTNNNGTRLGLAAGETDEDLNIRFPQRNAEGVNSYLVVDGLTGNCHQLGWSYQGIDATFYTYSGQVVTVRRGLITAVTGVSYTPFNPGAECPISDCEPYDPCDPPDPVAPDPEADENDDPETQENIGEGEE